MRLRVQVKLFHRRRQALSQATVRKAEMTLALRRPFPARLAQASQLLPLLKAIPMLVLKCLILLLLVSSKMTQVEIMGLPQDQSITLQNLHPQLSQKLPVLIMDPVL